MTISTTEGRPVIFRAEGGRLEGPECVEMDARMGRERRELTYMYMNACAYIYMDLWLL